MHPPVGGLFGFKFSSRPHPRKFGVQRFLVVREVAGAVSGVALFWATKPDGGRATRAMRLDDVLTELRPSHGDADHEKDWAAPPSIDENWPRTYARTGPVSGTLVKIIDRDELRADNLTIIELQRGQPV